MHFVNQDQTLARQETAEAWAVKKTPMPSKNLTFKKLDKPWRRVRRR